MADIPKPEVAVHSHKIFPQDFSFPNPMINYIKKNPPTQKFCINLLKSCKYFYSKKDFIIPLNSDDRRKLWEKIKSKKEPSTFKLPFKIWFTDVLELKCSDSSVRDFSCDYYFYKFATKFFLKAVKIYCRSIQIEELQLLSRDGLESLELRFTTVLYSNGTVVPVEEIFAVLKKIKEITFTFSRETAKLVTTETAENLAQVLDISELKKFYLKWTPKNFDFKAFEEFAKAHRNFRKYIYFKVEEILPNVRYWC